MPVQHEQKLQIALVQEIRRLAQGPSPLGLLTKVEDRRALSLLFAVPNGLYTSKRQAFLAKASGLRSGVPDLCLPVPRGGFAGLWLELKAAGGRLSSSQKEVIGLLQSEGHKVEVVRELAAGVAVVVEYLEGSK
jgi:hypothetical protein